LTGSPITSRPAAAARASTPALSASRKDGNNTRADRGWLNSMSSSVSSPATSGNCRSASGRRHGNNWNTAADLLSGGWQVTGIHAMQGGLGLTATLAGASVLPIGGERRARPNLIGDPVLPESERTLARWFNTAAFQAAFNPSQQAFGTAGVGIMRGPGLVNFDFTFAKNFNLTERRYFQFRTELFNAFNRANFGPPNIARDNSGFGQILSAANARIIQFGLKFYF
jgi:hypothetical protein